MKLKSQDTHGHQHVLEHYQRNYNETKLVLHFLVNGRMAHLQILKSINQVVVQSDSVKIFMENAMIIDRIDLSVQL